MADPADATINSLLADFPGHLKGTRPIHAPGIAATGWFQASATARDHTEAEHFNGQRVPVTVRFSNGTGVADEPDSKRTVRGMAVRFHLGEVSTDDGGVISSTIAADLISMTLPVFFTRTLADFMDFTRSAVPKPQPPSTWWSKLAIYVEQIIGMLRLQVPAKDSTPVDRAVGAFADGHAPARLGVAAAGLLVVPESYATCCYHAVHAFRLTAGSRMTSVRFHWEPVAGVRPASGVESPTFLREELVTRLSKRPSEFVLRIQVAEPGDDTSDPTLPWSQSRRRVVMGQLYLDNVIADQENGSERLQFDPARTVPGIDVCDDEIMAARHAAYRRSAERRLADRPGAGAPRGAPPGSGPIS